MIGDVGNILGVTLADDVLGRHAKLFRQLEYADCYGLLRQSNLQVYRYVEVVFSDVDDVVTESTSS